MPQARLLTGRRRTSRWWRTIRAIYRDTSALWREFRRPILVFLIAVFGGGWLYGELRVQAGYPAIPLIDLPYTMLMLMTLEAPGEPPHEPQLIAFWYMMPIIAAFVLGRGVVDFARLFFDRSERRNAWEEAVASTYRNHVIILGVGHLGLRVTRALAQMGFEVVAIDQKAVSERDRQLDEMHVPIIVGDGRLAVTLEKAGLRYAQALIVCTSDDLMNLEITMRARDLNPDVRITVRMWDDHYVQQIRRFLNVEAVMSASSLAAPVFAGTAVGVEIAQTLNVNGVDYSMIRLKVADGSFMEGNTIEVLQNKYGMDIVLHEHQNEVKVHPAANSVVRANDTLVIFAPYNQITDIVARNRRKN